MAEDIKEENIEFLEKEIQLCDKETKENNDTVSACLDAKKYWDRRRDFLLSILNVIK